MKTSMNLLRATNACTGGFGRQASFWTVRPKAKAIEYPIWMVGLIGSYDDLNWAINNSLIIDEAEFEALKDRTFWPMFQSIFWSTIGADFILKQAEKKAGDFVRDALQEALAIKDRAQAEAWMAKYRRYKINNNLFANVANHSAWTDPQQYLSQLTDVIFNEKIDLCIEHERNPFNLDTHVPGHDSRTGKTMVKRVARPVRRREYDDEEPTAKVDATVQGKNLYFDIPKVNGRVLTKGEAFAYVVLNEDPWPAALQFLLDNNVPKTIGSKVNLSKVSPDGVKPPQFAASLHLNDPRTIFLLMHLLQGQDFDLLKAMQIEPRLNRLERVLRDYGPGNGRMDDLDTVVDNEGEEWTETQERVVDAMTSANSQIAEAGPANGAVRERQIRTAATADTSWDGETTAVATAGDDEEEDDEV
jgi:hypothetical protein